MRRPTLCGEVHTEDDPHNGDPNPGAGTRGRLSRVKRMLTDSLLPGRRAPAQQHDPGLAKSFGAPLRDQPLTKEGIPVVVFKICCYLENNGLQCGGLFQQSAGNARLAERLRTSMDLERANDAHTTALLLKMWLRELPEPVIPSQTVTELLTTHRKVREEGVETWRQSVRVVLCGLPEPNLRLLRHVLRLLDRYCHHQQPRVPPALLLPQLAAVFAPLLGLGAGLGPAEEVTARLIQDHAAVFHQWLLDHPSCSAKQPAGPAASGKHNYPSTPRKSLHGNQQRKRKERNESANSNQSLERKVIRSSSEERHNEVSMTDSKSESMRRVSSHEDFSRSKHQVKLSNHVNRFTTVVELSDQREARVMSGLPLQECNHIESTNLQQHVQHSSSKEKENERELEDEHEKQRSRERVSRSLVPPRSAGRRAPARRKRPQGAEASPATSESESKASSKENQDAKVASSHLARPSTLIHLSPALPRPLPLSPGRYVDEDDSEGEDVDSLSDESRPESRHSFLQLHPPERERSPSPSVSPCTPPLDLSTLHQSVDGSEPVASRVGCPHGEDESGRGVLLSPRNSTILTRRVIMDYSVPPSPPGDHHGSCLPGPGPVVDADENIKKLNKQITSVKKKLKRYEEGFQREFGYRPSHADKMANKDIKHLYAELSYLRKELKQVEDNPLTVSSLAPPASSSTATMADTVADVERRMREKRRAAGRPESLDEMTAEQHAAEKLALQKSLLLLEKLCGRACSKQDREIVRPLYDRYRQLKRIVARAASSKLKDSINELATIHEHEAMEFTTSSSLVIINDSGGETHALGSTTTSANPGTQLQAQPSIEEASDSQTSSSDSLGENLHSLPLSDLVLQLTQTREEKKRLRRVLREQEEQFQLRTGRRLQREDRIALASDGSLGEAAGTYAAYKQIKAKLRLLEALVAKLR